MKQKLVACGLALGMLFGTMVAVAPSVGAIDLWKGCDGNSESAVCASSKKDNASSTIKNLIDLSLYVIGIVAVIVIIISGFQFITASGDPAKVKTARNTLIYSVVGLAVAMLAWAIVAFVVNRL